MPPGESPVAMLEKGLEAWFVKAIGEMRYTLAARDLLAVAEKAKACSVIFIINFWEEVPEVKK
jgi:hypothetical protein